MNAQRDGDGRIVLEFCTPSQLDSFRQLARRLHTAPSATALRKQKALRGVLFLECPDGGAPWEYPLLEQLFPGCWVTCCELYYRYPDGQAVLDELGVK